MLISKNKSFFFSLFLFFRETNMKIHVYLKRYENDGKEVTKIKRVELELDGMIIKLPPEYLDLKRKMLYNPISNLLIPLHPDITVYHVKK